MKNLMKLTLVGFLFLVGAQVQQVHARAMNPSEVRAAMLGKTIVARRWGVSIRLKYRHNGTVGASSLLGSNKGTWYFRGNRVCTVFPKGPGAGSACVTFTRTGKNSFVSSKGVHFSAY